MVQTSSAFASIYLLASIMYCNLFGGIATYNMTFFAHRPISLYHK